MSTGNIRTLKSLEGRPPETIEVGAVVEDQWWHRRWLVIGTSGDTLHLCSVDQPHARWCDAPPSVFVISADALAA